MKREEDSTILEKLIRNLEETLQTAKVNELNHLIEPIEETITRVNELYKTKIVKCDSIDDFQMACSCNDWGNDILAPNGKWICECGENCSCSKTWDSCVDITKKINPQKSEEKKEEEKFCQRNGNSCESSEENCLKEKLQLKSNSQSTSVSILYNRSKRKEENVNFEIKGHEAIFSNSKLKDSEKLKCENCKCSTDDKGKLIKTEECRIASESEKRKNDIKKSLKEEKCTNDTESSSSARKVLGPWDSRDERCKEEMKESFPQKIICEKPEKPLNCSEMTSGYNKIIKTTEENDERNRKLTINDVGKIERKVCESCPSAIKKVPADKEFSKKMTKRIKSKEKIIEKNVCKMEKITTACNECSLPSSKRTTTVKIGCQCSQDWNEKLKQNYTSLGKHRNCLENQEGITTQSRDGKVKKSDKEINVIQKSLMEEAHCSSNLFTPVTSEEELCTCGCGYFIEGVPETRPVSCNNISKNPHRNMSALKNNKTLKLHDCDCEGNCE